jgi:hypothetical protein
MELCPGATCGRDQLSPTLRRAERYDVVTAVGVTHEDAVALRERRDDHAGQPVDRGFVRGAVTDDEGAPTLG